MKQLTVTISGPAGSGKSHLLYEIKEFLKNKKMNVQLVPYVDYPNEIFFNNQVSKHHEEAIKQMVKDMKILIQEKQTARNPKEKT